MLLLHHLGIGSHGDGLIKLLAVINPVMTVNDDWPAVILSTVIFGITKKLLNITYQTWSGNTSFLFFYQMIALKKL